LQIKGKIRRNTIFKQRTVIDYEQTYARNVMLRTGKEIRFRFWLQRGQGWQGSKTQAYWLVVRVLLTPPAKAAASQKWKIIYLQVLSSTSLLLQNKGGASWMLSLYLLGRQTVTVVPLPGSLAMFSEPLFSCMNRTT
jgi:hypothetical protein